MQMAMTRKQGRVVAVCRSERKGTSKVPVESGRLVKDVGLEGDAHAGTPVRQVSLLCSSSLEKMQAKGPNLRPGDFAENLTIDGCTSADLPVGTRLHFERGPILEITQVGKACHKGCAIRELVGDCIMPREGLFARVVYGGEVRPGDWFEVTAGETQSCCPGRQ
mgnify:CR=1 FL=1